MPSVMPSPEVAARIRPSTGPVGIMPDQPPQRGFVELAVAERRHQRQPEAAELFSQVSHVHLLVG